MMFCVRQIPGEDLGKDADRPAQPVSASSTSSALSYAATGMTLVTHCPPLLALVISRSSYT